MAVSQISGVLQYLRGGLVARELGGLSDGRLLELFARDRDGDAFATLVRRHGPLVLGVCRRVAGHTQDAEDAFQATFLVLVRKAASLRRRELLANWLYGVAYRTALKARLAAQRRRQKEQQVRAMTPTDTVSDGADRGELRSLLDEALSRLPDKYRAAVLLCELQGKSREEAARLLGIPEGTLSSRLAAARKLLAQHLSRPGLVLSAAGVAALLGRQTAAAAVPAHLLSSTVEAATLVAAGESLAGVVPATVANLTEGVVQSMFLTKMKLAVLTLACVAALGAGIAGVGHYADAGLTGEPRTPSGLTLADVPAPEAAPVAGEADAPVLVAFGEARGTASGRVKSIDDKEGTVTLDKKLRDGGNVEPEQTFSLSREVKVFINDRPAKLTDIPPGCPVILTFADGVDTVAQIQARPDRRTQLNPGRIPDGERPREGDRPRDGDGRKDGDRPREGEPREGAGRVRNRPLRMMVLVSKVGDGEVTFVRRGEEGEEAMKFKLAGRLKLQRETAEDMEVPGDGGRVIVRPKLAPAQATDLKEGQRVLVTSRFEGQADEIVILREGKGRDGDRE